MKKYYWLWLLECLLAGVQRVTKKMGSLADLVKHKCLRMSGEYTSRVMDLHLWKEQRIFVYYEVQN